MRRGSCPASAVVAAARRRLVRRGVRSGIGIPAEELGALCCLSRAIAEVELYGGANCRGLFDVA